MKTFSALVVSRRAASRRVLAKAGFTLTEMLVVVGIISLLAALAIPNYLKAIQDAKNAKSADIVSMVESAKMAVLTEDATTGVAVPPADSPCTWADIENFVVVNGQTFTALEKFEQAMGIPGTWNGGKTDSLTLGTFPFVDPATGVYTNDTAAAVTNY